MTPPEFGEVRVLIEYCSHTPKYQFAKETILRTLIFADISSDPKAIPQKIETKLQ